METGVRRDDVAGFVDLLTSSQRSLFAYINTLVVGNSSAPDILQDTNLELWARRLDYDWSRPFLPWAYGFAYQLVLAYRKKQSRSKLVFSDEIVQQLRMCGTRGPSREMARRPPSRNASKDWIPKASNSCDNGILDEPP